VEVNLFNEDYNLLTLIVEPYEHDIGPIEKLLLAIQFFYCGFTKELLDLMFDENLTTIIIEVHNVNTYRYVLTINKEGIVKEKIFRIENNRYVYVGNKIDEVDELASFIQSIYHFTWYEKNLELNNPDEDLWERIQEHYYYFYKIYRSNQNVSDLAVTFMRIMYLDVLNLTPVNDDLIVEYRENGYVQTSSIRKLDEKYINGFVLATLLMPIKGNIQRPVFMTHLNKMPIDMLTALCDIVNSNKRNYSKSQYIIAISPEQLLKLNNKEYNKIITN
jgi:hypothetical protein